MSGLLLLLLPPSWPLLLLSGLARTYVLLLLKLLFAPAAPPTCFAPATAPAVPAPLPCCACCCCCSGLLSPSTNGRSFCCRPGGVETPPAGAERGQLLAPLPAPSLAAKALLPPSAGSGPSRLHATALSFPGNSPGDSGCHGVGGID